MNNTEIGTAIESWIKHLDCDVFATLEKVKELNVLLFYKVAKAKTIGIVIFCLTVKALMQQQKN